MTRTKKATMLDKIVPQTSRHKYLSPIDETLQWALRSCQDPIQILAAIANSLDTPIMTAIRPCGIRNLAGTRPVARLKLFFAFLLVIASSSCQVSALSGGATTTDAITIPASPTNHPSPAQKCRDEQRSKITTIESRHTLDEVEFHRHDQQAPWEPKVQMNEIITSQKPQRKACADAMKELDRCSSQLIGIGQRVGEKANVLYPDSMQDLNSLYCPRFRESISCVKNHSACFQPFERQVINWILTSTKRLNHKRCKNENEKIRFLRLTHSCFSTMRDPMDECMRHYIGSLDAISENYQKNFRNDLEREMEFERLLDDGNEIQIQLSCCANRRFKQCIMNKAKQMCKPTDSLKKLRRTNSNSSQRVARKHLLRSMQDTMEDLKSTLDEMALTGPEFICHNIDEKFCRSKFDGRYTNKLPRHRSIVPAMIKIYANK